LKRVLDLGLPAKFKLLRFRYRPTSFDPGQRENISASQDLSPKDKLCFFPRLLLQRPKTAWNKLTHSAILRQQR